MDKAANVLDEIVDKAFAASETLQVFESPIEEKFWWAIPAAAIREFNFQTQVAISSHRVDVLFVYGQWQVAIELDGEAFHKRDKDDLRDKVLLEEIDAIIHIPGRLIWNYPKAVYAGLRAWFPRLPQDGSATNCLSYSEASVLYTLGD